ncbi:MAG: isoprenylcysteine carboxylmethyltransferase family protein [Acidobacteriaceae bacterium]|nr:isoprenylcysteine carboxylmethyltransferase family protein [Acidobacteriaceae bacterium]
MKPRYWFQKPYADFVQRLRVPCGFLLLIAFAWLSAPCRTSLLAGLAICFAGLLLRAWAAGHLTKDRQLATSGPYAHMRNPLYAGTLLVACGIAYASRSVWLALIFFVVFVFVYLPAIELEEQHLREIFPSYETYAMRVPRFLPSGKWNAGRQVFSWARYRHNREYKALIGFLLAFAWLLWKWWRAGKPE